MEPERGTFVFNLLYQNIIPYSAVRLCFNLFLCGSISDIFYDNEYHEDDTNESSERIENIDNEVERNDTSSEYACNYQNRNYYSLF